MDAKPQIIRVHAEDDPETFQYRIEMDGTLIGFVSRGPGKGMTYSPWECTSQVAKTGDGRRLRSCERTRRDAAAWVVHMARRSN